MTDVSDRRARVRAAKDVDDVGTWLRRRGAVSEAALARARQRCALYGGPLDTALLQARACDETALLQALSDATGLDAATSDQMRAPDFAAAALLDEPTARALHVVPVAAHDDTVDLLAGPAVHVAAALDWAAARDRRARLFVTHTAIFEALLGATYGAPVTAEVAQALGSKTEMAQQLAEADERRRRLVESLPAPPRLDEVRPPPLPAPGVLDAAEPEPDLFAFAEPQPDVFPAAETASIEEDTAPHTTDIEWLDLADEIDEVDAVDEIGQDEPTATDLPPLLPLLQSPSEKPARPAEHEGGWIDTAVAAARSKDEGPVRRQALRALRRHLHDPRASALAAELRAQAEAATGARAVVAYGALAAIADPGSVPLLIRQLGERGSVASAAHAALVEVTRQDFGRSRWRWLRWWQRAQLQDRVEWLIDALGHRREELRLAASVELQPLLGTYVGYHFDLEKREREEAQRRLRALWEQSRRRALHGRVRPPQED